MQEPGVYDGVAGPDPQLMNNIILTAKNDERVEFYDGATHRRLAALDMPAPVHELALTPERAYGTVYGGGIFGKNKDPDHRVVVVDLSAREIDGFIDVGAYLAPHGIMFGADGLLWVTAEMNDAIVGIDVKRRKVVGAIDTGGAAHWLTVSPDGTQAYVSHKQTPRLAIVDLLKRRVAGEVSIPNRCEGLALSKDGRLLYVASHALAELNVVDTRTEKLVRSIRVEWGGEDKTQLRRVRVSPDERWLLLSSHVDGNVAIFSLPDLEQTALVEVGKAPMGFGFPAVADRALVCNHDDGVVSMLDLAAGAVTASFDTGMGCEFVEYY
jgi:6-phosphogluconolactonase (cycloisomerase 2 family)